MTTTRRRVMVFLEWLGALDDVSETRDARTAVKEFLKRSAHTAEKKINEICNKPKRKWVKLNSWDALVHPLLGLRDSAEGLQKTECSRHLPRATRDLLEGLSIEQRKAFAIQWQKYLSFTIPHPPLPLGHAIFGPLRAPDKQYDIIVWAHSDEKGGTELACTVALALRAKANALVIGVATPVPDYIRARYGEKLFADAIETPRLMHPEKHSDGGVDPERTYEAFQSPFLNYSLEAIGAELAERVRPAVKPGETLFVSCGEPLAMSVAAAYACKSIIVGDHLITETMRRVLESGGYFKHRIATLLDEIKAQYGLATVAYLPPQELASSGCVAYLSEVGVSPMTMRGLFYEAPTSEELHASEAYRDLAEKLEEDVPLVCVFGGGGATWSETLQAIGDRCGRGERRTFSLLIQSDPSKYQASWHLFTPEARNALVLRPPSRMLHWYALADLVVGRGGLVAQQVLACAHRGTKRTPHLLFVEAPGHPLIEDQRRRLAQRALVTPVELRSFRDSPLTLIQRAVDWLESNRTSYVRNVRLRYGPPVLSDLASTIIEEHVPEATAARLHAVTAKNAFNHVHAFSGLKVLVTGSDGFIGRALVAELRRRDARVVEFDLKKGRDVLNRSQLEEAAAGADLTFHLAGASSVTHFDTDRKRSWETTVQGLTNVLDVCRGRIVFPSTASIYDGSNGLAAETFIPREAINEYAKAKRQCELRCFSASKDVRVVRIFSGYGPGDRDKGDAASPVAKFLLAAETGERADVYGDGTQARDFVFVDDIVTGLIAVAMLEAHSSPRVCNIGTGKATTFIELLKMIKEIARLKDFDYRKRDRPRGYVESVVADTARAADVFGFRATVDLHDGLCQTIQADYPRLTRR